MHAGMHIHMMLHAIGIATVLLIVAYFIFVAAQRSMGIVAGFGTLLGLWLIALAIIIVAGAATAPMFGGKPFGMDFPHPHWMHNQQAPAPGAPGGPDTPPAPTTPDAPTEPAPSPN